MAVVQINTLNTQPPQALLTRFSRILGTRVHRKFTIRKEFIRKLRGQEYLVALSGTSKPFPDKVFVVLVHIRAVPEGFAELVCPVEDLETSFVGFGLSIKGGEAHQAETYGWYLRAILAEFASGQLG